MIEYFFAVGSDALTTFGAIALLYEGTRRMSSQGFSRGAAVIAAIGAIICITLGGVQFMKYRLVRSSIETLSLPTIPESIPSPSEWSKSLTPIQREAVGREIAGANYYQSGTLSTYLDRGDQTVTFSPTQKEVEAREERVAGLATLKELAANRFGDSIRWVVWISLAVLYGLSIGRSSRNAR